MMIWSSKNSRVHNSGEFRVQNFRVKLSKYFWVINLGKFSEVKNSALSIWKNLHLWNTASWIKKVYSKSFQLLKSPKKVN